MFHLSMSSTPQVINRETYTLFDMFGDVGGAAEVIWFVITLSISSVTNTKLSTFASHLMYTKPSHDQPKQETLRIVDADIYHNLDIVNLLARLRMHGFALALLFDQQTFKLLSSKAKFKPLKHPSELKDKNVWR